METSAVLDRIGELIAQLKGYAFKLPAVVHLASVPTGVRHPGCGADTPTAIASPVVRVLPGTDSSATK